MGYAIGSVVAIVVAAAVKVGFLNDAVAAFDTVSATLNAASF